MAYGDSRPGSVVYVVADDRGWHKIGVTADITLRLYHLSRDIGFRPVSLVHTIPAGVSASKVENLAHWALIDFEHHHEWFNVAAERAVAAIEDAMRRYDAGERMHARFAVQRRLATSDKMNARIREALSPGETRHRFIESAVEAELKRRERK